MVTGGFRPGSSFTATGARVPGGGGVQPAAASAMARMSTLIFMKIIRGGKISSHQAPVSCRSRAAAGWRRADAVLRNPSPIIAAMLASNVTIMMSGEKCQSV